MSSTTIEHIDDTEVNSSIVNQYIVRSIPVILSFIQLYNNLRDFAWLFYELIRRISLEENMINKNLHHEKSVPSARFVSIV